MLSLLSIASAFDSWITLACAAVIGYFVYILVEKRIQNFPPGPIGLPFVGYAPFIKPRPFRQFWELGKHYGDVVRINTLGTNIIILNSYEAIKECFSSKGDQFSGRVINKNSIFWYIFQGLGFLQEEGPVLRDYRRFSLHTLRDFGFGKLSLEGRVQEIGEDLVKSLANTKGKPYDPMNLLANAAFNVILYLTTDKNFRPDDPDFRMFRRNIRAIIQRGTGINLFIANPISRIIPMKWQADYAVITQMREENLALVTKYIKEHEDTFQENNLRDFIDAYLAQRNQDLKEGNTDTIFTAERMQVIVLNLLVAGSETTSNTIYWALRIISSRPEIQAKLHKELDEVVGRDRLPSILDRSNLPYTDAVILEILRFTTVAPVGIPHSNPAAATLNGYHIPARSVILANLWGVHNDPEIWEEPEKFNPDRFMDSETKAKRRERVIPFSLGKRSCLGESLARMEIFLFLTMLMQKFTFRLREGDAGDLQENKSFLRVLQPYEICVEARTI